MKKVLIIDDEIDLCVLLRSYFIKKDYGVVFAHNLADGLQLIKEHRPDILFLDNNLPDGTGWSHAPVIASQFPEMHINMISGFHPNSPAMPEKARYNIFEKPISFSDLDKSMQDSETSITKKLQQ